MPVVNGLSWQRTLIITPEEMSLPPLPQTDAFTSHLMRYEGQRVAVVMGHTISAEDLPPLQQWQHDHVAVFAPLDWFAMRDHLDQDWTVNDPKTNGQETLYSATFFFHAQNEPVKDLLELVKEKGWAMYAFDEEKAYCLVLTTGVAFDVDRDHLLKHLQES